MNPIDCLIFYAGLNTKNETILQTPTIESVIIKLVIKYLTRLKSSAIEYLIINLTSSNDEAYTYSRIPPDI
jgi:hypothetical protein